MDSFLDSVDSFFRISERGSSFRTEIKGGLTTFLSMSYILVVNPFILEGAAEGYTFLQLFTATALAAALSCLLMGLYARFPVSLAPGMGVNAFMAFTICYSMGFTFEQALAVVLVSGMAFFLISVTGLRKRIIEDIPNSMKLAMTAGIGFFIVVIGLYNSGLIYSGETSAMTLGNLSDPGVLLSLLCIATTLAMWLRNRWYAVIGGILMTWAIGLVLAFMDVYSETGLIPELEGVKLVSMPDAALFGKVFEGFTLEGAMIVPFIAAAISLLVVNIFDTTGTLIGVSKAAGRMDDEGHAEGIDKAMESDAAGSIIGAVCGTSTTTSFIESATGIESGARTGLMTVVVGLLFFVSLILGGDGDLHQRVHRRRARACGDHDDKERQGDRLARPPHLHHGLHDHIHNGPLRIHHERDSSRRVRLCRRPSGSRQEEGGPRHLMDADDSVPGVLRDKLRRHPARMDLKSSAGPANEGRAPRFVPFIHVLNHQCWGELSRSEPFQRPLECITHTVISCNLD